MDTYLAIQLTEHAFELLSQRAAAVGKTPAELAATTIEEAYSTDSAHPCDPVAARAAFEKCFGSVNVGSPIGIENAAIDADLARAYGTVSESS